LRCSAQFNRAILDAILITARPETKRPKAIDDVEKIVSMGGYKVVTFGVYFKGRGTRITNVLHLVCEKECMTHRLQHYNLGMFLTIN
jgi:hypothetical protein